jgi:5-methylcytosine-specific restriction endonuclease McrA
MAKAWAKSFYNSKSWKCVRDQVIRRDHYGCRNCYQRAEEVHHVTELTPDNIHDNTIALNPSNLISLCRDCHMKITHGVTGHVIEEYTFDENGMVVPVSTITESI